MGKHWTPVVDGCFHAISLTFLWQQKEEESYSICSLVALETFWNICKGWMKNVDHICSIINVYQSYETVIILVCIAFMIFTNELEDSNHYWSTNIKEYPSRKREKFILTKS